MGIWGLEIFAQFLQIADFMETELFGETEQKFQDPIYPKYFHITILWAESNILGKMYVDIASIDKKSILTFLVNWSYSYI